MNRPGRLQMRVTSDALDTHAKLILGIADVRVVRTRAARYLKVLQRPRKCYHMGPASRLFALIRCHCLPALYSRPRPRLPPNEALGAPIERTHPGANPRRFRGDSAYNLVGAEATELEHPGQGALELEFNDASLRRTQ